MLLLHQSQARHAKSKAQGEFCAACARFTKSHVKRGLNQFKRVFPDMRQSVPFMTDDVFPQHHFPKLWTTGSIAG
jgi:hypothetical protein